MDESKQEAHLPGGSPLPKCAKEEEGGVTVISEESVASNVLYAWQMSDCRLQKKL